MRFGSIGFFGVLEHQNSFQKKKNIRIEAWSVWSITPLLFVSLVLNRFTALVSDCPQLRISGITFVSLRSSTVRVRRNRSAVDRRSSASLRLYESANCDSTKKPTANRQGRAA
nr:hypothetical protein Iba_chr08bCG10110 [Ipomoea batatas]